MKRYFNIFIAAVAVAMMLCGCTKDENKLNTQQTSTVRFLVSTHKPRLMSEEAARESLDNNPLYYTVYNNETYRYIATMYDEGRDSWTEIDEGDKVSIYFTAYVFTYSSITSSTMPYWSNRAEVIEALGRTGGGLNPEYWSIEPLVLRAGSSDVLRGVSQSLVGCREGDEVEVYMTYPAAYGKGSVGTIPDSTPVAWLFTIVNVAKR